MSDPAPTTVRLASVAVGQQYVTADGSAHLDYIAWKKRFALTWEQVTTGERDALRTSLVGGVSFSLTVPGDATYTVFPVRGQYKHSPTGGASETWTVSAMVEVV